MSIEPSVAWDKINSFRTAGELAKFLLDEEIKGLRNNKYACPLAQWLKVTTGQDRVGVENFIYIYVTQGIERFDHTHATFNFIQNFDAGEYPLLERSVG